VSLSEGEYLLIKKLFTQGRRAWVVLGQREVGFYRLTAEGMASGKGVSGDMLVGSCGALESSGDPKVTIFLVERVGLLGLGRSLSHHGRRT